MKNLKAIFGIVFIVGIIAAVGGWCANIVKLINILGDPIGAWLIGRVTGIFVAPLGAILGYM